ncbi:YhfZ family protein [Aquamicrobium terrae]
MARTCRVFQAMNLKGVNYYRKGSVVVISRRGANLSGNVRIGFDKDSLDHSLLTQAEFAPGKATRTYIPCSYGHLITALMSGLVDCGIWHHVDLGLALDLLPLHCSPLRNEQTLDLLRDCESACLVFRSDCQDIVNIFRLLDPGVIAASQKEARRQHDEEARLVEDLIRNAPTRAEV